MHRPLWSDELCSQKMAIETSSWSGILAGQIHELNNPPLYFLLQKTVTSIIPLSFPDDFIKDSELSVEKRKYFLYVYPKGQIILRLLSDIFMSLAMVLLVRFFWIREGAATALIALFSVLSCGMVWRYWVEARPYSLWFLLTILQSLLLIDILSQDQKSSTRSQRYLIINNCLLALTVSLGLFQIIIGEMTLLLSGRRFRPWSLLPIAISLFYWAMRSLMKVSPNKFFDLATPPLDMIRANISLEQLALVLFYLLAFILFKVCHKNNGGHTIWKGLVHLPNFLTGLVLSIFFLSYVSWQGHGIHTGIPVYDRHFLFLAALGVVLIPALFSDLWSRAEGSRRWQRIYLLLFIVILISQFLEGFANAWFQGYYF